MDTSSNMISNQSQKQQLELNKTYEFDLDDMSHCGISHGRASICKQRPRNLPRRASRAA